jgi:hypothetical protein
LFLPPSVEKGSFFKVRDLRDIRIPSTDADATRKNLAKSEANNATKNIEINFLKARVKKLVGENHDLVIQKEITESKNKCIISQLFEVITSTSQEVGELLKKADELQSAQGRENQALKQELAAAKLQAKYDQKSAPILKSYEILEGKEETTPQAEISESELADRLFLEEMLRAVELNLSEEAQDQLNEQTVQLPIEHDKSMEVFFEKYAILEGKEETTPQAEIFESELADRLFLEEMLRAVELNLSEEAQDQLNEQTVQLPIEHDKSMEVFFEKYATLEGKEETTPQAERSESELADRLFLEEMLRAVELNLSEEAQDQLNEQTVHLPIEHDKSMEFFFEKYATLEGKKETTPKAEISESELADRLFLEEMLREVELNLTEETQDQPNEQTVQLPNDHDKSMEVFFEKHAILEGKEETTPQAEISESELADRLFLEEMLREVELNLSEETAVGLDERSVQLRATACFYNTQEERMNNIKRERRAQKSRMSSSRWINTWRSTIASMLLAREYSGGSETLDEGREEAAAYIVKKRPWRIFQKGTSG